MPNAAYGMLFNDNKSTTTDTRTFIELKYDLTFDETKSISTRIFYDEFDYSGTYPYTYEVDDYVILKDKNLSKWTGLEAKFIWDILVSNRLILGTEVNHSFISRYKEWDKYDTYFNKNFPHTLVSFFLQNEYQFLDNLSITAGLRYDNYSQTEDVLSPRFAMVYNMDNNTTIKAIYSQAFRAPSNSEMFYQSEGQAKPNPFLSGERIKSTELIFEKKLFNYIQFSSSIFWNYLDNMIQQVVDDSDNLLQFRNYDNIQTYGADFELRARSDKGYWGYLNYTYQFPTDLKNDKFLSNSPLHLLKTGFSFIIYKYLFSGIELYYESGRRTLSNSDYSEKKLNNVFLTNLCFTYEPDYTSESITSKIMNRTKLSFKVKNLFNLNYLMPVGFDNFPITAIQQRSRELLFTLQIYLDK